MRGTGRRGILVGGALLALLAVVALASRAHTPGGGGGTRGLGRDLLLEYVLVLMIAIAAVVVPVAVYAYVAGRDRTRALPQRRNWVPAAFVGLVGFAVLAAVVMYSHVLRHGRSGAPRTSLHPLVNPHARGAAAHVVRFDLLPVIVVGSLVAAGLAAAAVVLLRTRESSARPPDATELALAIEATLDDLRSEPDPRRAVIRAYAQMEAALARAGFPRSAAEAPREYLRRVLPEVGAGAESSERLTALFERAKFSPHAIDGAMKDEAIAALEQLRGELRSAD